MMYGNNYQQKGLSRVEQCRVEPLSGLLKKISRLTYNFLTLA